MSFGSARPGLPVWILANCPGRELKQKGLCFDSSRPSFASLGTRAGDSDLENFCTLQFTIYLHSASLYFAAPLGELFLRQ